MKKEIKAKLSIVDYIAVLESYGIILSCKYEESKWINIKFVLSS